MSVSHSYNLDCRFNRLNQVDLDYVFCLFFMRLSQFHDLNHKFDMSILEQSSMLLNQHVF